MIIANGTIEWQLPLSGGGLDPDTGFPAGTEWEWSAPVPCQFVPAKVNRLAVGAAAGEHFTDLSFEIYIEEGRPAGAHLLRLKDRAGKELGTFPVKGAEPLDAVCQLKLSV